MTKCSVVLLAVVLMGYAAVYGVGLELTGYGTYLIIVLPLCVPLMLLIVCSRKFRKFLKDTFI